MNCIVIKEKRTDNKFGGSTHGKYKIVCDLYEMKIINIVKEDKQLLL